MTMQTPKLFVFGASRAGKGTFIQTAVPLFGGNDIHISSDAFVSDTIGHAEYHVPDIDMCLVDTTGWGDTRGFSEEMALAALADAETAQLYPPLIVIEKLCA